MNEPEEYQVIPAVADPHQINVRPGHDVGQPALVHDKIRFANNDATCRCSAVARALSLQLTAGYLRG